MQNAKIAILNVDLHQELIEINRYFTLPEKIKNILENESATLEQCYNIVNQFAFELDEDDPIRQNTKNRLARSYDLQSNLEDINPVLTPSEVSKLRSSIGTSADIERSFSKLNKLLRKDRDFCPENIEYYICLFCNLSI